VGLYQQSQPSNFSAIELLTLYEANSRQIFLTKMAKEIRFAVGTQEDLCSSVWRLWANKNDLYLAARTFAGASKISFHESGKYRYASNSNEPRRPLSQWNRPKEIGPGITRIFSIVVPAFDVVPNFDIKNRIRDQLPPKTKPVLFLDAPDAGTKIIIGFLLTHTSMTAKNLLAQIPEQVVVDGTVPLLRESAWLIHHYQPLTAEDRNFATDHISGLNVNLKPGSKKDDVKYIFAHFLQEMEPWHLVEYALTTGNLKISS
jgi:hypothetical protein